MARDDMRHRRETRKETPVEDAIYYRKQYIDLLKEFMDVAETLRDIKRKYGIMED